MVVRRLLMVVVCGLAVVALGLGGLSCALDTLGTKSVEPSGGGSTASGTGSTTGTGTGGLGGFGATGTPTGTGGTGGTIGVGGTGGEVATAGAGGYGAAGGAGGSSIVEVELQVAANDRDGWDDLQDGSLDIVHFGDGHWNDAAGLAWSVPIPRGATIVEATVSVYGRSHNGATGGYTARLSVEDVNDAAPFDGAVNDIHNRSVWASTVDWSIPSAGLPIGTWSTSPNVTVLVQHIVDRTGWQPGNHLAVVIRGATDAGGCNEGLADYSWDSSKAAILRVRYQP